MTRMPHLGCLVVAAALAVALAREGEARAQAGEAAPKRPVPRLVLPAAGGPEVVARESGYRLRDKGDGSYEYEDKNWLAHVAPDGSVTFSDQYGSISRVLLGPVQLNVGSAKARAARSALLQSGVPSIAELLFGSIQYRTRLRMVSLAHADPRAACGKGEPCEPLSEVTAGLEIQLDLTDLYMRWLGQDPYRRDKARFLAATADFRLELARKARQARLQRSAAALPRVLLELWQDAGLPPVDRRRLLFQLWSEADGEGAASLRDGLIRFIRTELPSGSPDAYSQQELERYGRLSSGAFAPYAQ